MPGKITLKDIAKEAGVSPSTASLTLSGKGDQISAPTQSRVWQKAKELGYQIKSQKCLVPSETPVANPAIALLVDRITTGDPFIAAINSIRESAWKHGYLVSIYETGDDPAPFSATLAKMTRQNYAGLLFSTQSTREIAVDVIAAIDIPLALLNCYVKGASQWTSVLPGDLMGGYQATHHLIRQGFRRIAHISGNIVFQGAIDRLQGYRRALTSYDIPVDEDLICQGGWHFDDGYRETMRLVDEGIEFDSVFCVNDAVASGCYLALARAGKQIPEDVAIVGYDNLALCSRLSPGLTSMTQPYAEMGEVALEALMNRLSGTGTENHIIKVESQLVRRESSEAVLDLTADRSSPLIKSRGRGRETVLC